MVTFEKVHAVKEYKKIYINYNIFPDLKRQGQNQIVYSYIQML